MKKQFISSVCCPKCQQIDTIVRVINDESILYRCIQCGFNKSQGDLLTSSKPNEVMVKKIK